LSRGAGRLQRAILKRLHKSPEGRLSRLELAEFFVKQEGHTCSNLLRAIRGLERVHRVHLHDTPDLARAYVSLPQRVELLSDEVISELLREIRERP
jgi:hypothetical protein